MSYSKDARLIKSRYNLAKRRGLPVWACCYVEWKVHEAAYSNQIYRDKTKPRDHRDKRWDRARLAQSEVLEMLSLFLCDQSTLQFPPGSSLQPPKQDPAAELVARIY